MSNKGNDQVNNEAKKQAEEKENQELVTLTLEEAETEAELIKKTAEKEAREIVEKAETEAVKILEEAQEAKKRMLDSGETFVKELKNAKYIAVNNIREDGKTIKKGTAYNGKNSVNITQLLKSGAIKLNK